MHPWLSYSFWIWNFLLYYKLRCFVGGDPVHIICNLGLSGFSDLIIDTIRTTDHNVACEPLIYCVGALKFLTGNAKIVKELARKGSIEAVAQLLLNVNKTVSKQC